MRLSCQTVFAGLIVSTLACHDAIEPTPPVTYTLVSISGRPLPTFVSPVPEAPTITAAALQLHALGLATLIEHRHEMSGAGLTYTTNYTYEITGDQIQFDYNPPCPPNALCAAPPEGTIGGGRVTLAMYGSNSGVVYDFRFFGPE